MNLSHKLTFSLASIFLLLAFAAVPAMAQTIEATWSADVNDDDTADDPGWRITLNGLAADDVVAIEFLDIDGTAAAEVGGATVVTPVPTGATSTTGTVPAAIGTRVAVQVQVTTGSDPAVTYQRVEFPAGGPTATPVSETLARLPLLMKLAKAQYYATFGDEVTVTFDFAAAGTTNGAPDANIHISDITLGTPANWQIIGTTSTTVTLRSTHAAGATSVSTTVDLGADVAQPAATATDGQATVLYDDTAPTVTDRTGTDDIIVAAPPGSPTPPNGIWGGDFPVFNLTFSVDDDSGGSGLPDTAPVSIDTDRTKLDVGPVGLDTQDTNIAGTEYLVQITPKEGRSTTAGEDVLITVVPIDKAGNEGSSSISVKLAMSVPADALYQSAAPGSGNVMRSGTITVTFDKDPGTVSATAGVAVSGTGNTRTLTVDAAQAAGALSVTLTWGQNGRQVLTYTVVIPDGPAIAFTSAAPGSGSIDPGQAITLTFAADPGTVTSSVGAITGSGTTRTLTIPANQAAGAVTITVSWTMTGRVAGSQMLTYTVTAPFVSQNPTNPANISAPIRIPANSYVVVVRNEAEANRLSAAINFPTVDGQDVMIREWSNMPDLEALFNRSSYGQGGALVLRKSADARDNDTTQRDADGNVTVEGMFATPALGSVGISEIMWALDLGQVNRDTWKVGQWIELHNLNSKPVNVLLYAQTARELVSGGLVNMTAAGDSIAGALGGNVLDVVQNINDRGEQTRGGWDLPGKSGNSLAGENLVGAHRILPHNQGAYTAAQNYTKRDGRNKDHWRAATNVYASKEISRQINQVTTIVVADYVGTPGNRNNFTGVTLLKPDGRTGVPANRIVFNEVANRSNANKAYEWIELRNVTGGTVNLKNYIISAVTAVGTDTEIIKFAGDLNVPAGGILLVLASNPVFNRDHPIQIGTGVQHTVQTFKGNGLPDGGNFVLFLRGRADNKPDGIGTGKPDHVLDIAGYHSGLHKASYTNAISSTNLWPLKNFEAPNIGQNKFDTDRVHYRQHVSGAANASGVGSIHKDKKAHQISFQEQGYTGVGYKRLSATIAAHGGTPGYPNAGGSYQSNGGTVMSSVYISEIMYADNKAGVLPQWIELRNTSKSVGVDLHNVRLTITNHADTADGAWKGRGAGSVLLHNMRIKPNSAVLIASRRAVQRLDVSTVHMPSTDIFILWNVGDARKAFGMTSANDDVINTHGFKITLHANGHEGDRNKWQLIDEANNLNSAAKDDRGRSDERFAAPLWTWPTGSEANGPRVSVVRNAWKDGSSTKVAKGNKAWGWELSTEDPGHSRVAAITYYGDITDISTPGLTHGQPLPVELSYFRPTLENGKVTIQWTTESELDNAGFNILRSETRNGEFTQVNEQMIQGKGTTAERTTYKWVDTTAKPGVVYYYQIEDVSFAGEHTKLATTKLKGLISAKGKLTTQWGDLKNLR